MKWFKWVLILFVLSACTSLHKNATAEKWLDVCGPVPDVGGWEYCKYQSGPNPKVTLLVLHGMADSVQTVHKSVFEHSGSSEVIEGLNKSKGAIQIITISAGKVWPLRATGTVSVDTVLTKVIPALKKKHSLVEPFIAFGHSQGGFNGLSLCLAAPDLFSGCILTNPMIVSMGSYDTHTTISAGNLLSGRFTREEWEERNPIAQVERAPKSPRIYVQTCTLDTFKLEPDTMALVNLMLSKGFPVAYERFEKDCSHGSVRPSGILSFVRTL